MVTINGKEYPGNNISINNGDVIIDGKKHNINTKSIHIVGNVNKVETTSGDITIEGDVLKKAETMSGDITVHGDIKGKVETMSGDVSYSKNTEEKIVYVEKENKPRIL